MLFPRTTLIPSQIITQKKKFVSDKLHIFVTSMIKQNCRAWLLWLSCAGEISSTISEMTVFPKCSWYSKVHVIKVLKEPVTGFWDPRMKNSLNIYLKMNEHVLFYTCYKKPHAWDLCKVLKQAKIQNVLYLVTCWSTNWTTLFLPAWVILVLFPTFVSLVEYWCSWQKQQQQKEQTSLREARRAGKHREAKKGNKNVHNHCLYWNASSANDRPDLFPLH